MTAFERISREVEWRGRIISAGVERFRFADGAEVRREKVWHPGAVCVLALDDEYVWLTRQPREAVRETASLEIPAGKFDVPGELPLDLAQRELVEEIGKQAGTWRELFTFWVSPGFSDERVWLYLATDLRDAEGGAAPEEDERIEIVPWSRARLGEAIAATDDAKTLIALLWLESHPI